MRKLAALSEIAEINPRIRQGIATAPDGLVSFLPMASVLETGILSNVGERPVGEVLKGYTAFERGDVLLAKITPCMENGKAVHTGNLPHAFGFGSTEFHVLRPKAGTDGRYLFHMVWNPFFREAAAKNMTGSAGQKRVPTIFFEGYKVPHPPLHEQKRIAAILDKADELRAKRRAALAELDQLTQSIFLEMFGDPVANPKKIPTGALEGVCNRVTDGTHQPPQWSTTGHPFLFVSNIVSGEITYETKKFISDETHASLTKRCPIDVGDVLYSTVGSYGVPALVREPRKFAFQRHIAHLKPDHKYIDSVFLCAMMDSPPLRQQADRAARGVAQKTLNLAEIKKFVVFRPPMDVQRMFTERVVALEKLRAEQRASLAEFDTLFASLQYLAFRGEL